MKTGPDAIRSAENVSGSAKHENSTERRGAVKNESECSKLENGTRHPQYRGKTSLGTQNMKTRADTLGTAENESRSAKLENGTRRPRYRRK
jgi:hypothetical protein